MVAGDHIACRAYASTYGRGAMGGALRGWAGQEKAPNEPYGAPQKQQFDQEVHRCWKHSLNGRGERIRTSGP